MSDHVTSGVADMRTSTQVAEHLQVCQKRVSTLSDPEKAAAALEEMATTFQRIDPELSAYLRIQIKRLGTGEEIRHSVRHGVPPLATMRQLVGDRLRLEEERHLAKVHSTMALHQTRGILLVLGVGLALALGAGLWGMLWLLGVENPWGGIIGGIAAVVVFFVFHRGLKIAAAHLIAAMEEREP
jgi:hypothetical protein